MFTILTEVWAQLKSLRPSFASKNPHFNFITIHYFWIIGMSLFGSICLYPRGGITYINALFLATGAATQSGLNTVDLNTLNTWQQIILFIVPMICNPIAINTFVVFLRLYWFEKRFQHIASEAKKNRRSMAKSVSKAKGGDRDIGREERGVQGRSIVVMHDTTRPNGMTYDGDVPEALSEHLKKAISKDDGGEKDDGEETANDANEHTSDGSVESNQPGLQSHQTQIRFADQVKPSQPRTSDDDNVPAPIHRNPEEHIAFLERQRNLGDSDVLRIPGPRDADAGVRPEMVDGSAVQQTLSQRLSTFPSRRDSEDLERGQSDDENLNTTMRRNITIQEPPRPSSPYHVSGDLRAAKSTLGVLRFRKPRIFGGEKVKKEDVRPARTRRGTINSIRRTFSNPRDEGIPYLSWEPTIGRNSAFVDLTESQREELGGIEYRSLKSLALILTLYFWGFAIFGFIGLTAWILNSKTYGPVVKEIGQGRAWWGIYTANSAFTDLGFTLTPDSMQSFQKAVWPLVLLSFLIIIGNTGFPIMLRVIIWVTSLYVPKNSGIWEELRFLLDHPRRCFTLLFPSKATWYLFWILAILNGVDLIFFIILDLGNTIVTQLPVNIRVLNGWFQAVSTRTVGFGVVNLAELHPGIQVSYLVMMYISVLPIAISVRRTNVYEEKSLGLYGAATEERMDESEPSYVGAHLRRQLSFDLWYIFLGLFIISISEGSRLQSGDPAFTMFAILFEIVSAYGTVGLSLGYTGINASLSAEFGVVAKLVIIAMQVRGRHRGLPYALDRAILLPSESLHEKENADPTQLARRRSSSMTNGRTSIGDRATNTRSRSKSAQRRQSQNIFTTLLHPGPTIPNSHRGGFTGDSNLNGRTSMDRGRETSPKSIQIEHPSRRQDRPEVRRRSASQL